MLPTLHTKLFPFGKSLLLACALLANSHSLEAAPVKIFILAGESNMHGKGTVSPATTQGTLDYIVANDPTGKYQFLKSGGNYVTRTDVTIRGLVYSGAPNPGGLTVGYGGIAGGLIGPELGFGHRIGDAYEDQVMIVKVGVDGTTLGGSFCPPSSRVGDPEPVVSTDKGFYYKEIIRLVNEAKVALGGDCEVVGFGWHQGWNDRVNTAFSAAYETNMANFINNIRTDLAVPNMPFVIASAAMDSGLGYSEVEIAQLKMANPTAYPAFAGNVAVVDTRKNYEDLEFWQSVAKSPANEGYHWNRSGKTFLHIGLAMGDALSLLAPNRIPYRPRSSGAPGGTTLTWNNGTETPTSVRVLRNGVQIAASASANPASFVDATPPLGVSNYELQFTMPISPVPSLTISHNSGVTNLVARLRVNGAHLSWQNNLSYAGLTVKRNGTVIAASLPGSTTSYVDISPPSGVLSYTVEPTTAGSAPAQASLKVSAYPAQTAVIYEPFDMTVAALDGQKGGLGLDGDWVGSTNLGVIAGSQSFGTLPTFGNSIQRGGSNGPVFINIGTTLTEAGLLANGAELWFSFLHRNPNNINTQPSFILGNGSLEGYFNDISGTSSGIGVRVGAGDKPQPILFNAGTYSEGAVQTTIGASEIALIVGKITWGATPSAPDMIQIFTPGTNLTLDTPTSHSAVLDQSSFNVISMWGNGGAPEIDEIRFGASYVDVTGQGVNTSGDFTPPAPATMFFASPPAATSQVAITMTATAASDANGVQYFFDETSGNPGGTDSGWQDSPVYIDTGLNPATQYAYTVQARDKSVNNNTNTVSSPASATTLALDTTAPAPNPMTWATPPAATGPASIVMTATIASDVSGVEYFFDETSGNPGGTDSGWQDSPTYIDSGLNPSTTYAYQVRARDKSPAFNETDPSSPIQVTTQAPPVVSTLYWDGNDTTANADGGVGTWIDGTNNWDSAATAGLNTAWNNANNDNAVFAGTAGTVTIGTSGVTVGALQFDTASYVIGNYGSGVATGGPALNFGPSGNITNNVNTVISAPIGGTFGLSKTGSGLLELRNTANTFTGNISVGGGTLRFGQESNTAGINDIKLGSGNFTGTITIATGATLEFWSSQTQEFSGIINGTGSVNFRFQPTVTLSGANTYTGKTSIQGRYNGQTPRLKVSSINSVNGGTPLLTSSSLGAPTTVANGTIELGIVNLQTGAILEYTGSGETTDRIVSIPGAGTSTKQIINSGSGILTFTSPMIMGESGWTDTELQIDGSGNVVFQGFNAPGRMEAIIKRGAGSWSISGNSEVWDRVELYAGTLSVTGAISDGGILYPANGGFITRPTGKPTNQVTVPNSSILAVGMTVSHGRLTIGTTITQIIDSTTIELSNVPGGGSNLQERAVVGFRGSLGISTALPDKLRWVNSATLRYNGPDDSTNRGFLIDAGDTATWEIVNGVSLTVSGSTTATTGKITKAGDGKLELSGNLLHTGSPNSVSAGTLLIDGNATAMTGSVDVANGATFGGKGTLGGNLNVAVGGKLTFDLSTTAASHDRLELAAGRTLTFSGASTLTITSTAGASPGLYTLISGGNSIAGVTPSTVILPSGWTANPPVIVGNELRLNITSIGGSAYDTWKTTNAPTGNPDDDFDSDGVDNAVEFVLGGTSSTKDLGKLPVVSTDGNDMVFIFQRAQSSIDAKTTTTIEVGTDLLTWPTPTAYAVPDGVTTNSPGVTVEKNIPAAGSDKITLRIPKGTDPKKFARLKVAITP
jgi:autotransporter-associated beta strand protein